MAAALPMPRNMFDKTFATALGAEDDQMAADAAARLARAHAEAEMTSSARSSSRNSGSRARGRSCARSRSHATSRARAQKALDLYVHDAPDTARFRKERGAIEAWLGSLGSR